MLSLAGADLAVRAQDRAALPVNVPQPIAAAQIPTAAVDAPKDAHTPSAWQPSRGRECIRSGRFKGFCQGPRRVPVPSTEARARALRLGLGARGPAARLLVEAPPDAWVAEALAVVSGAAPGALLWPVDDSRILRGFGAARDRMKERKRARPRRRHPHEGVDIGAAPGAPIHAAQAGLVVYSDNVIRGYGNLVIVVHADGSAALYSHCRANYVAAGTLVRRGEVIGEVGETGYARGPHLHFEYRVAGRARNPMALFDSHP